MHWHKHNLCNVLCDLRPGYPDACRHADLCRRERKIYKAAVREGNAIMASFRVSCSKCQQSCLKCWHPLLGVAATLRLQVRFYLHIVLFGIYLQHPT